MHVALAREGEGGGVGVGRKNKLSYRILRPMKAPGLAVSGKIRDEEGLGRRRNFRYSSRTAASLRVGRATGNHPRLYRNRIYIRPRLSVRRPQRTPQRGTVVNNEYASVFVYSGSTQRVSRPSPLPPLPIHRPPYGHPFRPRSVVNCNTRPGRLYYLRRHN